MLVLVDHVHNVQIHAVRANFHSMFSVRSTAIAGLTAWTPSLQGGALLGVLVGAMFATVRLTTHTVRSPIPLSHVARRGVGVRLRIIRS